MTLNIKAVNTLYPGQTPVDTSDCLIYALTKEAEGTRVFHINDDIPFPHNFLDSFLSNSFNKNDIGLYLAKKLVSIHAECGNTLLKLCVTYENRTVTTLTVLDSSMVDSTAEEAEQKLFVTHSILLEKNTQ